MNQKKQEIQEEQLADVSGGDSSLDDRCKFALKKPIEVTGIGPSGKYGDVVRVRCGNQTSCSPALFGFGCTCYNTDYCVNKYHQIERIGDADSTGNSVVWELSPVNANCHRGGGDRWETKIILPY